MCNEYVIGIYSLNDILYEDLLGDYKSDVGKVKVSVFSNEGDYIPHVHITGTGGNKFDCCVCLHESKYFMHGKHRDIMNSPERKAFDRFMSSTFHKKSGRGSDYTNWDEAWYLWYKNNGSSNVKKPDEKPDYRSMTESIVG